MNLCRASPEVAPYPFTTLTPNLGVLASDGSGTDVRGEAQRAVLADLPGLIQGAHTVLYFDCFRHCVCHRQSVGFHDTSAETDLSHESVGFIPTSWAALLYMKQCAVALGCAALGFQVSSSGFEL